MLQDATKPHFRHRLNSIKSILLVPSSNMPVYIATQAFLDGVDSVPFIWPILKTLPWLGVLYLAKIFFSGASNTFERNMHGKVVMVTVRSIYIHPALSHMLR